MRKPVFGFPTMSDTKRAVQLQKLASSLTFQIRKKRDCTLRIAKTKALISFAVTAKLICVFVSHMQTSVLLMMRLICTMPTHIATGQLYVTVISTIHAILYILYIYLCVRSGQVRSGQETKITPVPCYCTCNQYNLFPCGRMGLVSLGRPLV